MVIRLRESGLTMKQIGQQMVPKMTGERVRQIINANAVAAVDKP